MDILADILGNGLALLFTGIAAIWVVGNHIAILVNLCHKRRGLDRRMSLVLVLPQISLLLAAVATGFATNRLLSPWLLLGIALADPGLWYFAVSPFRR